MKETIRIGYLGPEESTNGYVAATRYFNTPAIKEHFTVVYAPHSTHEEIVESVAKKHLEYGVVAVENVINGVVVETVRSIERHAGLGINVCGEVGLPVELALMSKHTLLSEIQVVVSHPVGLSQCKENLRKLFSGGVVLQAAQSTGEAAKQAAENQDGCAALALPLAAEKYGLNILQSNLADFPNSITRFWVLHNKRGLELNTSNVKTCILVNIDRERTGALYEAIGYFSRNDIGIAMLYPCPIPNRPWEYTFVIELWGSIYDDSFYSSYVELRDSGVTLASPIVLGSYPDTSARHSNVEIRDNAISRGKT